MFEFLKKKPPKNLPPPVITPVSVPAYSNSVQQHSNIKRELIRVVLKDTLRLHGVPTGWLACEVIIIPRTLGEEELHIQLVILKWNEQLLRYANALQQQLLLGLDRFDPAADHSKYMVSWRFAPDCGCPFSWMPEPKFWAQSGAPATGDEPTSVLDRRQRKRPPKAPLASPPPPNTGARLGDYSHTEISPLR